jgi:hypothetical protein
MTIHRALAFLLAFCFFSLSASSQFRSPYGAVRDRSPDGFDYIRAFNTTPNRISLEVSYTKQYADGKFGLIEVTVILEIGELNKVVNKCAHPKEKISNVIVKSGRVMKP